MKKLNEYLIPFIGLKLGKHQFEYQINKTFFDYFEYDDFEDANIQVNFILEKKSLMLELHFSHKGTVYVPCDVTGEMFDLPVEGNLNVVVQFGDEFNNENEEILILPHGEHQVNISQYIYEMIALSVPLKRVHPGIENGTLKSETLDKLNEFRVAEVKEEIEADKEIDPRWDKLKQLLTDK